MYKTMDSKPLKLTDLKVQSFVTEKEKLTRGGARPRDFTWYTGCEDVTPCFTMADCATRLEPECL